MLARGCCSVVLALSLCGGFGCGQDPLTEGGCGVEGQVMACECAGGGRGAKTCRADMTFSACDCEQPAAPDAQTPEPADGPASAGGAGAGNGGSGDTGAGGSEGSTGGGGDGAGAGAGGGAGTEAGAGAGTGGSVAGAGAQDAGGAGSQAGVDAGSQAGVDAGSPPVSTTPYAPCDPDGCAAGEECQRLSVPVAGLGELDYCASPCTTPTDCPDPPQRSARPQCEEGRCRLDCGRGQNSCPEGMLCVNVASPTPRSTCMWPAQ